MAIVEATIQYVNPAGPGKKYGNIKTSEGGKYLIKKGMESQFLQNEVCKFDIYKENWKDGPVEIVANKIGNGTISPKQVTRTRMDPSDARGAFITVILEAFVTSGKVPLNKDAIALARQEIAAGYDMSHNPQRRDDMADEIPY